MTLKDLIMSVDIEDIMSYFSNKESEKKYIYRYRKLIEDLKNKEPEDTSIKLFLVWQKDYFEEDLYISVLGLDIEDGNHYALDFMSRGRWLGSEIIEKSLNEFGAVAFVCECLAEMSFISFEESDIEEEKRILNERVKEIEEGTAKTIPAEEVFAELREKYGWEVHERTLEEDEERSRKITEIKEFNDQKLSEMLGK